MYERWTYDCRFFITSSLVFGLQSYGFCDRFSLGMVRRPGLRFCRGLATYPVGERSARIWLNVDKAGGVGARHEQTVEFRVISNTNVSTFIKELVLEPVGSIESIFLLRLSLHS